MSDTDAEFERVERLSRSHTQHEHHRVKTSALLPSSLDLESARLGRPGVPTRWGGSGLSLLFAGRVEVFGF